MKHLTIPHQVSNTNTDIEILYPRINITKQANYLTKSNTNTDIEILNLRVYITKQANYLT